MQANDTENETECYKAVRWIYTDGFYQHPDWYEGLTPLSPFEALQQFLHDSQPALCPAPCAPPRSPPCQTQKAEGPCRGAIVFAMNDGIISHPEWYPELRPGSPWEDFQLHIHNKDPDTCPLPCPKD